MSRPRKRLKIVFLDIDGVLNSSPFLAQRRAASSHREAALLAIDPLAVGRLDMLVRSSSAKVVVSSAWRHAYSSEQIGAFLMHHGFTGEVIDSTPTLHVGRGYEIREWLIRQPAVESFVILDDIKEMAPLQYALVNTSSDTGLLDVHVDRALKILRVPTRRAFP